VTTNEPDDFPTAGDGWTNTYTSARRTAEEWLDKIHTSGMRDVELLPSDPTQPPNWWRWTFIFYHRITGKIVLLETHGVDETMAFREEHDFLPQVYWAGSSVALPNLADFAADGYEPVMTYQRIS
jgi:hypothetical protein